MAFQESGKDYSRYVMNSSRRLPRATHDALQQVIGAGYTAKAMSPFHLHVRKPGIDRFYVNVWPTASKIMEQYGYGANIYIDLLPALEEIFSEVESDREEPEPPTEDEIKLAEYRKNPLGKISGDDIDLSECPF